MRLIMIIAQNELDLQCKNETSYGFVRSFYSSLQLKFILKGKTPRVTSRWWQVSSSVTEGNRYHWKENEYLNFMKPIHCWMKFDI